DVELQIKLGQAYLAFGQLAQARDAATKILDKQPGHEEALILLAQTAVMSREVVEAQTLIDQLRAKNQDRPGYHVALGLLAAGRRDRGGGKSELKAALALAPKASSVFMALGALHFSRRDIKPADEAMKSAAELSPPRSPMQMRYVDFKLRSGAL